MTTNYRPNHCYCGAHEMGKFVIDIRDDKGVHDRKECNLISGRFRDYECRMCGSTKGTAEIGLCEDCTAMKRQIHQTFWERIERIAEYHLHQGAKNPYC
jgi:RecJ-like exonuclease